VSRHALPANIGISKTVGPVAGTGGNVRAMGQKVKVFIGTEKKTEIARKVLEVSVRRRTDADVEFVPMLGKEWEYSTDGFQVGTGFSLRRWMIPAACGWQGRAIYLDADQIVFGDIWDLWTQPDQKPSAEASVWCTYQPDKYSKTPWPQTSVMVIDCARAKDEWAWHIDKVLAYLRRNNDKVKYADLMHCAQTAGNHRGWWTKAAPVEIDAAWNHLNVYLEGKTRLLHYTKEPEQPWYKPDHPHALKWQMELQIALSLGAVTADEIRGAVSVFGVKEDWRGTNGLHPDYLRFIPKSKAKK